MRAYEVFASMSPERAAEVLNALLKETPAVYTQAVAAASVALKARPQFLMKQAPDKRAQLVRRALSRVASSDLAEEVLATYFIEVKKPLLEEWLDAIGLEHEDGILVGEAPDCPDEEKLGEAIERFLKGDDRPDRELLLSAFAAQRAIDWPALERRLPA